ncbi:MAG: helix-turn-helix transcriptional regulator [Chloroflexi bacterium]|nr:helix-turn-helix transcriptional regulator [Chloroflexota bacterium]
MKRMRQETVLVTNADRMMTTAALSKDGIGITFADSCRGSIPFADLPEIKDRSHVKAIELPNPYQVAVRTIDGDVLEIPWDFARHYCDPSYRARVEKVAKRGREALGRRARQIRIASGLTQEQVASVAGIGRVTLARIESGDQSPRLETLVSLAKALARPVQDLMLDSAEVGSASSVDKAPSGRRRAARPAKESRPAGRRSPRSRRARTLS